MGCVFWQYNDCWPCTSWSSVDYFGRWKALQYAARRFYAPVLVSGVADAKKGTVAVYVTSDRMQAAKGKLTWDITTVDGHKLRLGSLDVDIPSHTSGHVITIPFAQGLKSPADKDLLVWLKLEIGGKTVSENLVTLAYSRELELLDPRLNADVTEQGGDLKVKLTAAHPALYTWLLIRRF